MLFRNEPAAERSDAARDIAPPDLPERADSADGRRDTPRDWDCAGSGQLSAAAQA